MFEKAGQSNILPTTLNVERRRRKQPRILHAAFLVIAISTIALIHNTSGYRKTSSRVPYNPNYILSRCEEIANKPGPPAGFHSRQESDRFVPGTEPVLIRNATIWTGLVEGEVNAEIVKGDVLLDKGVVKQVGSQLVEEAKQLHGSMLQIVDVHGAWVTPGYAIKHIFLALYNFLFVVQTS